MRALYEVVIEVHEVRGRCAAGYRKGDRFSVDGFLLKGDRICIHALAGMISLLSPFSHGVSARALGIGSSDDEGYVQCPDPGTPFTCGGTVVFRLKRVKSSRTADLGE